MRITSRVSIKLDDLEKRIEGFHSDYYELLEKVDTELDKELGRDWNLVFYDVSLDDLYLVEEDVKKIINTVEQQIEEIEEDLREEREYLSALDKRGELHAYFMQNTI